MVNGINFKSITQTFLVFFTGKELTFIHKKMLDTKRCKLKNMWTSVGNLISLPINKLNRKFRNASAVLKKSSENWAELIMQKFFIVQTIYTMNLQSDSNITTYCYYEKMICRS